MEREQWHIFYLKVTSLIAIFTFLIVTLYLAIVFGNYYAIYETQYSVKLELHEIQRTYLSQYIYICYLGCLITCDLIACLAILFNLNYIILFDIFHHLTLLLVKLYSGFELDMPGEHSLGVLGLFVVLHTTIIISLSLLYKKLDSVSLMREILREQLKMNANEDEQRRLSDRDQLNTKLMNEYQQKYLTASKRSEGTVELEPVDIEQDFDTIKQNLKIQRQQRNDNVKQNNLKNSSNQKSNQIYQKNYNPNYSQDYSENKNKLKFQAKKDQTIYDSDGYLKVNTMVNQLKTANDEVKKINQSANQNRENLILDKLNKQNQIERNCRTYSVDDESTDLYFEPDACDEYIDDYMENVYDYLKCDIDKSYADEYLKRSKNLIESTNKEPIYRSPNQLNQLSGKQLIDKCVQTNHSNSSNETGEVFYTANENDFCFPVSTISTGTSGLKESHRKLNEAKSRKIEYSTLKYDHKILYETSV